MHTLIFDQLSPLAVIRLLECLCVLVYTIGCVTTPGLLMGIKKINNYPLKNGPDFCVYDMV